MGNVMSRSVMQLLLRAVSIVAGTVMFTFALALVWRDGPAAPSSPVDEMAFVTTEQGKSAMWGFFHPAWTNQELTRLSPLIDDPMKRADVQPYVSEILRPRVLFWMAIYGVFSSHHKMLHDRLYPDLIYGHLDLSSLAGHLTAQQFDSTALRIEKSVRSLMSKWLLSLAEGTDSPASLEETVRFRNFLVARGFSSPEQWRELASGLRTQSGQRDHFLKALERSRTLLPEIEKVFAQHGLPRHVSRIPFVESSFHPRATSKIGALGIWQFTPITAKDWISRKDKALWSDPKAQTEAAARMLRSFRKKLPDWGTSVTAYNSGLTRMQTLLKRMGANRLEGILSKDMDNNGLGFAGENFYSEVLAATIVEAYKTEIFTENLLAGMLALKEANDTPFANYCHVDPYRQTAALASSEQGEVILEWLSGRVTALKSRIPFFQE